MKEIIERIGTKTIIIASSIFLGIVVLVIAGALIYNKFFYKRSFEDIETIMTDATINYCEDHKDSLPKSNGETNIIKVNKLVSGEYMKSISDYLKDDSITCKANVNVTKVNKQYRYTPILDCGEKYQTELLVDKIKNSTKIVTSGDGLYELNNELVYRGENPNNNIELGKYKWKIVKITDDRLVLIFNDYIKDDEPKTWDDRYNKEKDDEVGINDYTVSRALEYVTKLYNGKKLFNQDDKLLISSFNLYIGKRKEEETNKTGEIEKSKILENQYIGLLPAYDYMNASLDNNCTTTDNYSCTNYNYLAPYEKSWWLLTGDASNSYKVYKTSNYSNLFTTNASGEANFRPIITLVKDTIYIDGNGTTKHPYTIK